MHIERGGEEHNGRGRREATEKGGRDGGKENILHQAIIICRLGRRGRGGEGRAGGRVENGKRSLTFLETQQGDVK